MFNGLNRKNLLNTSHLFIERASRILINLFVGILIARKLGLSDFGTYNYSIALVSIFQPLIDSGLNALLVKRFVNYEKKKYSLLGTSYLIKLSVSIIVFVIIYFSFIHTSSDSESLILLIISFSIFFYPSNVFELWFESQTKIKFNAISRVLSVFLSSILKIAALFSNSPLFYLAIAYTLEFVFFQGVIFYLFTIKEGSILRFKFEKILAKSMLSESWPLIFSGLAAIVYFKIDQVMLSKMIGDKEVGLYSAAARISEVWYFIPIAITNSLFPEMLRIMRKSEDEFYAFLQRTSNIIFFTSFGIAIIVTLLSDNLITLLYGNEYIDSSQILKIHIWCGVFYFFYPLFNKYIVAKNLLKYSYITQISGAVVNVILNLILIPKYGGKGAAYASLISYSFTSFFLLPFFNDCRKIFLIFLKSILFPLFIFRLKK